MKYICEAIIIILLIIILYLNYEPFQIAVDDVQKSLTQKLLTQTSLGLLKRPIAEKKTVAPRFLSYETFTDEYKIVDLTNVPERVSIEKYKWADAILRRKPAGFLPNACSREEWINLLRERGWLYLSERALNQLTAVDIVEIERRLIYLAGGIEVSEPIDPMQAEIELIERKDLSRAEVITTLKGANKVRSKVVADSEMPDEQEEVPKPCRKKDAENCRELAMQDKCFEDPKYMHENCPNICNLCGVTTEELEKIQEANVSAGRCTWRPEEEYVDARFLY